MMLMVKKKSPKNCRKRACQPVSQIYSHSQMEKQTYRSTQMSRKSNSSKGKVSVSFCVLKQPLSTFTPAAAEAYRLAGLSIQYPHPPLSWRGRSEETPSGLKGSGTRARPILQRPCTAWMLITAMKPQPGVCAFDLISNGQQEERATVRRSSGFLNKYTIASLFNSTSVHAYSLFSLSQDVSRLFYRCGHQELGDRGGGIMLSHVTRFMHHLNCNKLYNQASRHICM